MHTTPSESDRTDDARRAWFCIARIFHSRETHDQFLKAASVLGLTARQLSILFWIHPEHPRTMSELAESCHTTPSYMSGVVDTLVDLGLVERSTPPSDRRRKLITRTAAGDNAVDAARQMLSKPPSGFEELTDSQTRSLRELLEKVAARYESLF